MVRAISNSDNESKSNQVSAFTPALAAKMLPLVRRIVEDLMRLNRSIEAQREQLHGIDQLSETIDQADYSEELSDVRESLEDDEQQLAACIGELTSLGLKTHLPIDGSVDFPAVINRRSVCLCWNPKDGDQLYWHEVGETTKQRQKIDPQSFAVESLN
ncbi:MAG: DUF2203 family protein [Rubripirellula sp.]